MSDEYWLSRYAVRPSPIPADAIVTLGYVVGANAVLFVSNPGQVAVRSIVGLPLLFFLPGYATVAALFPRGTDETSGPPSSDPLADGARDADADAATTVRVRRWLGVASRAPTLGERASLSVGTSVVLLPILGLCHSLFGLGFDSATVIASLSAVVVVGTIVGVAHRRQLPPDARFALPIGRTLRAARAAVSRRQPRVDLAVNVLVALAAVVALASVSYAVVVPNGGSSYASMSVLTENETGSLVADGYPETVDADGADYVLRVENGGDDPAAYGVVAELQRVEVTDGDLRVVERREVGRVDRRIAAGAVWTRDWTVAGPPYGEDLRVAFYLYRGEPPETPDASTAYRRVSVRVDAPRSTAGSE